MLRCTTVPVFISFPCFTFFWCLLYFTSWSCDCGSRILFVLRTLCMCFVLFAWNLFIIQLTVCTEVEYDRNIKLTNNFNRVCVLTKKQVKSLFEYEYPRESFTFLILFRGFCHKKKNILVWFCHFIIIIINYLLELWCLRLLCMPLCPHFYIL